MKSLDEWQKEAHSLAQEKGWYEKRRTETEFLMLIASEVFEAFDEVRNHKPGIYEVDGKPEGVAVELGDTVLRILDYFEYRGWSLNDVLEKKHNYNRTRSTRHGGKKL